MSINPVKFALIITVVSVMVITQLGRAANTPPLPAPLKTVEHVDLKKYSGQWYDVAHYPHKYQEECQDTTALVSVRTDGELDILTSCKSRKDGAIHHTDGRGWVIDTASNARFKFSFLWPFRSEYLIIDQGKEYDYAVICTPDRKHLWIISRTATMTNDLFENIARNIEKQGFRKESLIKSDGIKFLPVTPTTDARNM